MEDPNRPVTGYPAPPGHNPPNGYPAGNPPPTGTAYPYATSGGVPPSNGYYSYPPYQQNYPPDPVAAQRAACIRRIFGFLIGLIIVFGTVTFIVWLVLRPQLPEFRVDSLSLSNFTLDNNSLISFTSQTHLTARNPNKKMSLVYDRIDALIYFKSDFLSQTSVTPFSQDTKTETPLNANFAAAGSFLERTVVDSLNSARTRNGVVELNFRMLSRVRFEAKAWRTRRRYLRVFCGPLNVAIPANASSGTLTNGPRQCSVGI